MRWVMLLLLCLIPSGCVERILTVNTNPPGAIVYLNDQEAGRTPLKKDFTWYGVYNVQVRAEGFETIKDKAVVNPPPWGWPPLDLVMELIPWRFRDTPKLEYTLKPLGPADPQALIRNSEELKKQMSEK